MVYLSRDDINISHNREMSRAHAKKFCNGLGRSRAMRAKKITADFLAVIFNDAQEFSYAVPCRGWNKIQIGAKQSGGMGAAAQGKKSPAAPAAFMHCPMVFPFWRAAERRCPPREDTGRRLCAEGLYQSRLLQRHRPQPKQCRREWRRRWRFY